MATRPKALSPANGQTTDCKHSRESTQRPNDGVQARSLKAGLHTSAWAHQAGTTSEPFAIGPKKRGAVKVIDERGKELVRVLEVGP